MRRAWAGLLLLLFALAAKADREVAIPEAVSPLERCTWPKPFPVPLDFAAPVPPLPPAVPRPLFYANLSTG